MPGESIIPVIRRYLQAVCDHGIPIEGAVLYGSYARGQETPESDIDLIVLSSLFDREKTQKTLSTLWRLRASTDCRIEPIAAGVDEWTHDRKSPILEIARSEGIAIPFLPSVP
jgi:predicted nucleotidyltransferase